MAATRVEAQQSDSKYEKSHEDQPQDIVFHNGRENVRGIIFCDNKSHSKSKISGQNNIDADMSQYRSDTSTVVSVQNSANDEQNSGNSNLENSKKNRDGKSVKHNSEQSSSSDQHCTKVSDSGQNMQMYNIGLSGRGSYHPDHRGPGAHMQSNAESSGLPQNPFSHLRPMNRHSLHSSKPVPNSPVMPSRPMSGASSGPPGSGVANIQPKLFSGQSISQQTGPTPTLNQLLQSSHPLQRHQNSYSEFALQKTGEQGPPVGTYHQMWAPHQSSASCNPHSVCYRGQVSGSTNLSINNVQITASVFCD
ncbi:Uncharacterized protein GBIM_07372 [Gryllus bimaculatus]|nr:Uncharacterized protein GBIM_07372 [Gryllus bimaculatus]